MQAITLCNLHLYLVQNWPKALGHQLHAARRSGITKREVLDVCRFALLSMGKTQYDELAEPLAAYMDTWQDDDRPSVIRWPEGFSVDSGALRSGIDLTTTDLTPDEAKQLITWHTRMSGEVPRYVELWLRLYPSAYKTHRARYETALEVLPVQMAPLLTLSLATWSVWPSVVRRSILQARALGVQRHHVVQIMTWTALIKGGEWKLDAALEDGVADLLTQWE